MTSEADVPSASARDASASRSSDQGGLTRPLRARSRVSGGRACRAAG